MGQQAEVTQPLFHLMCSGLHKAAELNKLYVPSIPAGDDLNMQSLSHCRERPGWLCLHVQMPAGHIQKMQTGRIRQGAFDFRRRIRFGSKAGDRQRFKFILC
jgi:hypothetical protein